MNLISYVKEKGVVHSIKILWEYKIDIVLQKNFFDYIQEESTQKLDNFGES